MHFKSVGNWKNIVRSVAQSEDLCWQVVSSVSEQLSIQTCEAFQRGLIYSSSYFSSKSVLDNWALKLPLQFSSVATKRANSFENKCTNDNFQKDLYPKNGVRSLGMASCISCIGNRPTPQGNHLDLLQPLIWNTESACQPTWSGPFTTTSHHLHPFILSQGLGVVLLSMSVSMILAILYI